MIGAESGREQQPDGICSVGAGEQGPNLPVMRVGGIDVPDSVRVIGMGVQVSSMVSSWRNHALRLTRYERKRRLHCQRPRNFRLTSTPGPTMVWGKIM